MWLASAGRRQSRGGARGMRMPPSALLAGLLFAACAHAQLLLSNPSTVLESMPVEAPAAHFSTSEHFRIDGAPLVLSPQSDWSLHACPPVYLGAQPLAGAIVILHALTSLYIGPCSIEQYARAVAREGAAAIGVFDAGALKFDPVPGFWVKYWVRGDSRDFRDPPTVHLTQQAAMPLIASLQRQGPLRASLSPTPSAWTALGASWTWALTKAVRVFANLACLELGACRLYAFARVDGGPQLSAAHSVLAVNLVLGALRIVHIVVDNRFTGLMPLHFDFVLNGLIVVLGASGIALFLLHFLTAAGVAGVASQRLTRQLSIVLVLFIVAIASFDVLSSSLMWQRNAYELLTFKGEHAARRACGDPPARARALPRAHAPPRGQLLTPRGAACPRALCPRASPRPAASNYAVVPCVLLALTMLIERRASVLTRQLPPPPLIARLVRKLRLLILLSIGSVLAGVFMLWAFYKPWRTLVGFVAQELLGCTIAYLVIDAFHAAGRPSARGPIKRAIDLVVVGVAKAAQRAGERRERQRVSPAGGPARAAICRGDASAVVSVLPGRVASAEEVLNRTPVDTHGVPPHLLLGVSPRFIREFCSALPNVGEQTSSYDICAEVSRVTSSRGCSLAESLCSTRTFDGRPTVGEANLFISHAHSCSWLKMMRAVDAFIELYGLDPTQTFLCARRARALAPRASPPACERVRARAAPCRAAPEPDRPAPRRRPHAMRRAGHLLPATVEAVGGGGLHPGDRGAGRLRRAGPRPVGRAGLPHARLVVRAPRRAPPRPGPSRRGRAPGQLRRRGPCAYECYRPARGPPSLARACSPRLQPLRDHASHRRGRRRRFPR